MKTITFNSNFGHFKTRLTGQFPEELSQTVGQCALADILYRVCGSKADKELGVNVKKPKEGQLVYKDRKAVPYTTENYDIITRAVVDKINELSGVMIELDEMTQEQKDYEEMALEFEITGKHEFGETVSPMVMATTLVEVILADDAASKVEGAPATAGKVFSAYSTLFEVQGYAGSMTNKTALIEFAHSKGLGIRPAK